MKSFRRQLVLGLGLLLLSASGFWIHYTLFHDVKGMFFYLVYDLAFLPVQVLLVTLVLEKWLTVREKREKLQKMNMVIGAFYSEVGTALISRFARLDPQVETLRAQLLVRGEWTAREFQRLVRALRQYRYEVAVTPVELEALREFLLRHQDFLLRLLENQNLLEHETFTDLLRAVFHLSEELLARDRLGNLPESDLEHLAGDTRRAYGLVVQEWVGYLSHLQTNYPFLFSFALRTNPFDRDASVVVRLPR